MEKIVVTEEQYNHIQRLLQAPAWNLPKLRALFERENVFTDVDEGKSNG